MNPALVDPVTGAAVWYRPEDAAEAVCRYQPCGSALCPCAAGMPSGTVPATWTPPPVVPGAQTLPEVVTTVPAIVRQVPAWAWVGLGVLLLGWLTARRPAGRRQSW